MIGSSVIVVQVRYCLDNFNEENLLTKILTLGTLTNQCSLQGEPTQDTDTLYDSAGNITTHNIDYRKLILIST